MQNMNLQELINYIQSNLDKRLNNERDSDCIEKSNLD